MVKVNYISPILLRTDILNYRVAWLPTMKNMGHKNDAFPKILFELMEEVKTKCLFLKQNKIGSIHK